MSRPGIGSFENGRYGATFLHKFSFVGQGKGNNFLLHSNFRLTINANGDVTTQHDGAKAQRR